MAGEVVYLIFRVSSNHMLHGANEEADTLAKKGARRNVMALEMQFSFLIEQLGRHCLHAVLVFKF